MKVLVAPVVWRSMEVTMVMSLFNLMTRPEFGLRPFANDALIERSRGRAAAFFLDRSDADVMLAIDGDIEFMDSDAAMICEQAMTHDIVSGVYVTRSQTHAVPTSRLSYDVTYEFAKDPTPLPVEWPATGFVAIHRRVFEKMRELPGMSLLHPSDENFRMYPFYLPFASTSEDGQPIFLSEDWAFGERAKQAGFQSYINPACRLGHWGQKRFMLEDMLVEEVKPMPMTIKRRDGGYSVGYPDKPQEAA
jgi:hypothetical protein